MKKLFLSSLIFVCVLSWPAHSHAQLMDGGLDVFEFPCTCSPFTYVWLAPLWLGPVPMTGAMAIADTPNLFPFFIIHPGAWELGFETPGVQSCWMYAAVACFPLPVLGTITPFTGTSI